MKKIMMTITVLGFLLSGCATTDSGKAFQSEGLPKQQYYVGGGFSLNYRAPSHGTVLVVEERSRKLIITESLDKDQYYSLDINPRDEEIHMRLKSIGVDPTNMKLGLYFVPAQDIPIQQVDG